jgi:DNA topoisomerase-3
VLCGRSITPPEAAKLLTDGKTEDLTGFTSKAGKQFSAALKLEEDNVAFVFSDKKQSS